MFVEASRGLLHNRLILAALGLVAVLLLVAVVLSVIGNGAKRPTIQVALPAATATMRARALQLNGGLLGRILATVSVRNGPNAFLLTSILGTVPRGTMVAVVGRNADRTWLQIVYPPDSVLRGWVDARFVQVTGDVSALTIAGPGPQPEVALPTSPAPLVRPTRPSPPSPEPTIIEPRDTPPWTPTRTVYPTNTPRTPTRTVYPTNTPGTPASRFTTPTPPTPPARTPRA